MKTLVKRFVKDESGATAIEYGLIAAGISVAIITVVQGLGTKLNTTFSSVTSAELTRSRTRIREGPGILPGPFRIWRSNASPFVDDFTKDRNVANSSNCDSSLPYKSPVVFLGMLGRTPSNCCRHLQGEARMAMFKSFLRDEYGATAIEYGLIAAGISVAIIAVVQGLGSSLNDTFTNVRPR